MQKIENPLTANYRLPIRDHSEAVSYLDGLLKYGMKSGLVRIRCLSEKLKNPQFSFPVIQVAGTNGKSSVTKMIGAVLTANGLRTGVYLSPHLYDYTERFSIDNRNIDRKEFLRIIRIIKKKASEADKHTNDPLTNFEILTAAAFKYFADQKVDVAVVEVGLGGRFDATSVSSPSICVITNVDLDHVDILGNTIPEIAAEKASIIKKGKKAVIGKLNDEALSVIKDRITGVGAEGFIEENDFKVSKSQKLQNGCYTADIDGIYGKYKQITTPLPGSYQLDNLSVAIAASEIFIDSPIKNEILSAALSSVKLGGRLQVVSEKPKIIIDVSHNPAGIKKMVQSLSDDFKYEKLITIFAAYKDKDYKEMIGILKNYSDKIYLTQNYHERSASPQELAGKIASQPPGNDGRLSQKSYNIKVEKSLEKAIDLAREEAGPNDLICITGSFSTASVAGEHLKKIR